MTIYLNLAQIVAKIWLPAAIDYRRGGGGVADGPSLAAFAGAQSFRLRCGRVGFHTVPSLLGFSAVPIPNSPSVSGKPNCCQSWRSRCMSP